ncbi:MAG: peptidoglycan-associated lipoprotein Pal [Candidatus Rokuibacteriota bacterium]
MRRLAGPIGLFLAVLTLGFLLGGCPKRPATTVAQAPVPTAPPTPAPAAPAASPAPEPVPAPVPAPPREFAASPGLRTVHFDFDRSVIRLGDARILDATADWLKSNPRSIVLVQGHCDERGTSEYNLALGDRRARAVVTYLTRKGIDASRFTTISYGEARPVCSEKAESCWARNRRTETLTKER